MTYDAIIIGAGFYGVSIALYLKNIRGFKNVLVVEQEDSIMLRASFNNQARIHNGYHYPRSFTTAFRSRVNLPRFMADFPEASVTDFTKIYAIAKNKSKVTAKQFAKFCNEIGAELDTAQGSIKKLFNPYLIEEVFLTQEYAFDSAKLAQWANFQLCEQNIEIMYNTIVTEVNKGDSLVVSTNSGLHLSSKYLFNCTYCGLNQIKGDFPNSRMQLKHEITEMALVSVPDTLKKMGITVMDGAFFSVMPFPAKGLHSLSHVRYTPHFSWGDSPDINPYDILANYHKESRVDRMVRDAGRYLPVILESEYRESLFEVKSILVKNEGDDGRPILFEKHSNLQGCYSILGGKIDNIYDILEQLQKESFDDLP